MEHAYKNIYLAKRHPSLSEADFPARWRQHSALSATTKNIRPLFTQVAQCCRLFEADFPEGTTQQFDAVNLMGLRDLQAATDLWREPETLEIMEPDELLTFSRPIRECTLTTRVDLVKDGPPSRFVILRFLRRSDRIGAEDFLTHWAKEHAALELHCDEENRVMRYVHNQVVLPPPPNFQFDLITELWFPSIEAARRYHDNATPLDRCARHREEWCHKDACVTFTAQITYARPEIGDRLPGAPVMEGR